MSLVPLMLNATPFLKLYAAYRKRQLERSVPAHTQERELLKLLSHAKDTTFGKEYDFASIRSVQEYQKRVPLRRYESFWEEYWQKPFPVIENCTWPGTIPYFPVTSGTTSGTTKYIPYTKEMEKSNTKAGLDLLSFHLQCKPGSQIFAGRSFILGGSTALVEEAPGIFSGDLSGISVKTLPWWAKARYFPPADLALLQDWEEKVDRLSDEILKQNIRMISGVPAWLLIFFDTLFEKNPSANGKLHSLFPNLEMIVHGGVNFSPYHQRFVEMLEGSQAELREVYPASEGFIAVADRGYAEGLRMILDHGIFYEFIPFEELESETPTRHWIGNVEKDVNYAIVLSTCAGIWSYVIGDTVTFVDTHIPRLLITGRTSYYLSAFGEHLIAEEIEAAITAAAQATDSTISDYSVGAYFPQKEQELGKHIFVIESASQLTTEQIEIAARVIDETLAKKNEDYEAHRAKGFGLDAPEILPAAPGCFAAWMQKRGKLGGQNKVPRIITKTELFEDLLQFVRDY